MSDQISRKKRSEVIARDSDICQFCGETVDDATRTVDHVIPESKGGDNELENLQLLCRSCNSHKRDRLADKTVYHARTVDQARFAMIPEPVLFCPSLSVGAKATYAALKFYAWASEECWPGQARLAVQLGVTEKSLRGYVRELVAVQILDVRKRGRGQTCVYILKPIPADLVGKSQPEVETGKNYQSQPDSRPVEITHKRDALVPFLTERAASADEDTPIAPDVPTGSVNSKPKTGRKEKAPKADGALAEVRAEAFRLYRAVAGAFREDNGGNIFGDQVDALVAKGFSAEEILGGTNRLARLTNPYPGYLRREVLRYREEGPPCIWGGYRQGLTPGPLRECSCRLCLEHASFYEREVTA